MVLVVAFNYGARQEIARAAALIAAKVKAGEIDPAAVNAELVGQHLDAPEIPDPDLIIRTSGEQRLSNFLLWQAAYSELVFVPTYWPDFDRAALEGAIAMAGYTFVPTYLHERFGLSLAAAGGVMAFFGLGGLVYAAFAPWIIRRLGERGMALAGGVGLGLSMAALAWAPQWHWSPASCLLGGLSFYLLHNTLQANATQMQPSMRGTAVSLFASSLFCGQSLGVVVAAWIADPAAR